MNSISPSSLQSRLRSRFYPRENHPFRVYARSVHNLAASARRVLDIGCGHGAPDLESIPGSCQKFGIDPDPDLRPEGAPSVCLIRASATSLPFAKASFDLLISKSVLEHLESPEDSFDEFSRVLKPRGRLVILTPNRWDYVSLASTLVPNRLHPWLVRVTTGRAEEDTFPTYYRANTAAQLRRLASNAGLDVEDLRHLREHPHYLKFSNVTYVAGVAFEQLVQRPVIGLRPWLFAIITKPKAD